jgi:hypothetical protein
MGYVLKTAFWLGLTLRAMPLGDPPNFAALTPEIRAQACETASRALAARLDASEAYRAVAAASCESIAASVTPPPSNPAPTLRGPISESETLTASDRRLPWSAPPLPPVRPRTNIARSG